MMRNQLQRCIANLSAPSTKGSSRIVRSQPKRGENWVTLFLPPAFKGDVKGDVKAAVWINVGTSAGIEEWNWWREQYSALRDNR